MPLAFDDEVQAVEAAAVTATRAREIAQERIVVAFRRQLREEGPGPSEAELHSFARLALVEEALRKELVCAQAIADELRVVH